MVYFGSTKTVNKTVRCSLLHLLLPLHFVAHITNEEEYQNFLKHSDHLTEFLLQIKSIFSKITA